MLHRRVKNDIAWMHEHLDSRHVVPQFLTLSLSDHRRHTNFYVLNFEPLGLLLQLILDGDLDDPRPGKLKVAVTVSIKVKV